MPDCFFVSDLHGLSFRYDTLLRLIYDEKPEAVFIAGDILPSGIYHRFQSVPFEGDFIADYLRFDLDLLRKRMGDDYPDIFIIMGNDDARSFEKNIISLDNEALCVYMHNRKYEWNGRSVYGYACVPPTPFRLKDWERYDVSRFVDTGSISPEEGAFSTEVDPRDLKYRTIKDDLESLAGQDDLQNSIFLFHAPPYQTKLDRVELDGMMIDHVPLDVNVGSIAMRRFIEARQPLLTLHGHIHESTRLTGSWIDNIGSTVMLNAAHDGPELCLVRFDPNRLEEATREIIGVNLSPHDSV